LKITGISITVYKEIGHFRIKSSIIKMVKSFIFLKKNEYQLSKREKEILKLISDGKASKEIADDLYISVHTVNTHRQNILEKLNVKNSHEAIKIIQNYGLNY